MSTRLRASRPSAVALADPLDLESRLSSDAQEEGAQSAAADHDLVALARLETKLDVFGLNPSLSIG